MAEMQNQKDGRHQKGDKLANKIAFDKNHQKGGKLAIWQKSDDQLVSSLLLLFKAKVEVLTGVPLHYLVQRNLLKEIQQMIEDDSESDRMYLYLYLCLYLYLFKDEDDSDPCVSGAVPPAAEGQILEPLPAKVQVV